MPEGARIIGAGGALFAKSLTRGRVRGTGRLKWNALPTDAPARAFADVPATRPLPAGNTGVPRRAG